MSNKTVPITNLDAVRFTHCKHMWEYCLGLELLATNQPLDHVIWSSGCGDMSILSHSRHWNSFVAVILKCRIALRTASRLVIGTVLLLTVVWAVVAETVLWIVAQIVAVKTLGEGIGWLILDDIRKDTGRRI